MYHIYVTNLLESQMSLLISFKTDLFHVTGHFRALALNGPPNQLKCYQVKDTLSVYVLHQYLYNKIHNVTKFAS